MKFLFFKKSESSKTVVKQFASRLFKFGCKLSLKLPFDGLLLITCNVLDLIQRKPLSLCFNNFLRISA